MPMLSFTALLITATSSCFFSRSVFVFCYDEAPRPPPWQPAHDYYHIDLGELGGGHHHHDGGGFVGTTKVPVPRDVMVDVVNELGIKLLAIHNEHNDNNIAISPYGALSVLAALAEGVQGDAAHEIAHAAHIPKDKHVIRVGLRDIHRHLKSYFIPEEGFLAGLTLNLNNVTLKDEYEDVLRFYGFDYSSFNNALYPEPPTTKKPSSETSTLGITFGMPEGTTTVGTTEKVDNATTVLIDTRFNGIDGSTTESISGKEETTTQLTTIEGIQEPTITTTQTSETTKTIDTTTPTTQPSTTLITTRTAETIPPSTTSGTTTNTEKETIVQPGITSFYNITTTDEETTYEVLETSDTTAEKTTETTRNVDVTTQKEVTTSVREETTTVSSEPPTESVIITTKISKVTIKPTDSTTTALPETTRTTTVLPETTAAITTEMVVTATPAAETTPELIPQTSTETTIITTLKTTEESTIAPATTTDFATTTESSMTTTESLSTKASESTTNILPTTSSTQDNTVTTQPNGDSQRTTREISNTIMGSDNLLITIPLAEATEPQVLTTIPNKEATILGDTITTQPAEELPTMPFIVDETTVPIVNPVESFGGADDQNGFATPAEFFDQPQMDIETTIPSNFGTTSAPEYQDMTTFDQNNFDYNYNYDANIPLNGTVEQIPPVYDENMANLVNNNLMLNEPGSASLNRNLRRRTRSVVDYVIARFYDDHHPYIAPAPHHIPQRPVAYLPQEPLPRPLYVPRQEPLTFAVYGKYRESAINFMKYDTVLPFYYAANLNALALSFPLDSTKYYLLLLLPVDDNGVDQLICDLRLYGNLRHIIEHLRPTHVVATIPSFKLKGYVTLTPLLQRLGIRKIFEPRQADFSPMTNVTDIYVTNIEQAVTVTIRNYLDSSAQHYKNFRQYQPVQFKADHPFLYFVIDTELNIVLMEGKVINPLNSRIS